MSSYISRDQSPQKLPYIITALILVLSFILLLGRLWYLQLFQGSYFQDLSENNRIRLQDIPATRGMIFDRNGNLLVDNQPAFDLAVIREDARDIEKLLSKLEILLGLDKETVRQKLIKNRGAPPFVPIVVKSDLTWEEVAKVETYKYETPGLTLISEPRRFYPYPSLAAHLIGYTGEVTKKQLKLPKYRSVRRGDRVGQYGIELTWQTYLAGKRGGRQVEVDATGRPLSTLKEVSANSGSNLYLTIDYRFQKKAEEAMSEVAGALVAIDPQNGEVLAMVSRPAFDQLDFVKGLTTEAWKNLVSDPLHPLDNRAISGQYPPGSPFKIITAIAALSEGIVSLDSTYYCPGFYRFGNRNYGCWRKGGHGEVDFYKALVESCDVYFYRVSQKLGVDKIAKYSHMFGLGKKTGIELNGEKPGLVPTTKWKKKRFGVPWQDGETLSVAIGQGFNLVTPLQLACLTAAVANGGRLIKPSLALDVKKATNSNSYPEDINIPVKPEVLNAVKSGLIGCVNEERGSGKKARLEGITVGGKTGTAQVVSLEKFKHIKDIEDIPYKYRDHAWFVAFAPVEKPSIAIVVLAEHSGGGGRIAAPIAQKVITEYFNLYPDKSGKKPQLPTDNSIKQITETEEIDQ